MTLEIPLVGMMILTMLVWFYMYFRRLSYFYRNNFDYKSYPSIAAMEAVTPAHVHYPAHNLRNLFELPVLFYIVCFYLIWENQLSSFDIYAGYIFFIGRIAHSVIQCSYNNVQHRFTAYVISSLALWALVVHIFLGWFFFI